MNLKFGFQKVDITPPIGIELAGYGPYLDRKAESVHDPLYVRALVLENPTEKIALISVETIGLSIEWVRALKEDISKKTDLKEENILIACTHTHSGPATLPWRGWGKMDSKYMEQLRERIERCILKGVSSLTEVTGMRIFKTQVCGISYNRVKKNKGKIDNELKGILIEGKDTKVILLNYACHPVVLGINREVSADYPGQVLKFLEEKGYEGLFFNGCCGDINPLTTAEECGEGRFKDMRRYGKMISREALLALGDLSICLHGDISSKMVQLELPLKLPSIEEQKQILLEAEEKLASNPEDKNALFEYHWAKEALEALEKRCPDTVAIPLQVIKIGQAVLVCIPAEVFVEIGLGIKQAFPEQYIFVIGYANGVVGYIPTLEDFRNNGYAATLAPKIYGNFPFREDVGKILVTEVVNLLRGFS